MSRGADLPTRRCARGVSMSKFTEETSGLDKMTQVEGEIRDFVRRDFMRRPPNRDGERVATNISSLLEQVSGTSLHEIDRLIADLTNLRARLLHEGTRVQREILEYAGMSQAAMRSTRILADSLSNWKSVPDAPSISE
jgi:hypothetical protein